MALEVIYNQDLLSVMCRSARCEKASGQGGNFREVLCVGVLEIIRRLCGDIEPRCAVCRGSRSHRTSG